MYNNNGSILEIGIDIGKSLKMWLEDRLTKYKIPKFYQIINKFPKTQTGKIMKHKLKILINES